MPDIAKDLENQVKDKIKALAKTEAVAPRDALEPIEVREAKIEHQLSQYMLYAKKRCIDGFFACFNVIKEIAETELHIDLSTFEANISAAFSRFDSVASANELSMKIDQATAWKDLLGITDQSLDLLYRGAKKLTDSNLHPEAEAAYFFLTTIDFKQYSFWLGLGHAAFHLGNLNQAINAYEMAECCQKFSVWPHIYAANCFEALNDHEEALTALETAYKNYQEGSDKEPNLDLALQERIAHTKQKLRHS